MPHSIGLDLSEPRISRIIEAAAGDNDSNVRNGPQPRDDGKCVVKREPST